MEIDWRRIARAIGESVLALILAVIIATAAVKLGFWLESSCVLGCL